MKTVKFMIELKCKHCKSDIKMEYNYCPKCGEKISFNDEIEDYIRFHIDGKDSKILKKKE